MIKIRPRVLLFLLFLFGAGLVAAAQSTLGSVSGTVRDSTGAAIPNATVTLHRVDTNTDRAVITDAAGNYNALNLDPGPYTVIAKAASFSTQTSTGLRLLARQSLQFDIALAVNSTESVTVDATAAGVINTDDASIAASLTPEAVLDLPRITAVQALLLP